MKTIVKRAARKVLIVDDHPIIGQALTSLLEDQEDLTVCGQDPDAGEALNDIENLKPDMVVVDISLRASSGIELIKEIKARWPDLPILVMTMHDESVYAERSLRAGARGFLLKSGPPQNILTAIRRILDGGIYLSDSIASQMVGKLVGVRSKEEAFPLDRLSDRELEIFEHIGRGMSVREIARKLHLSPKTVETHREHIKTKLGQDSAAALLRYAIQWEHGQ